MKSCGCWHTSVRCLPHSAAQPSRCSVVETVHHFSNGAPVVSGTLELAASKAATSSSLMRQPKPPAHPPHAVGKTCTSTADCRPTCSTKATGTSQVVRSHKIVGVLNAPAIHQTGGHWEPHLLPPLPAARSWHLGSAARPCRSSSLWPPEYRNVGSVYRGMRSCVQQQLCLQPAVTPQQAHCRCVPARAAATHVIIHARQRPAIWLASLRVLRQIGLSEHPDCCRPCLSALVSAVGTAGVREDGAE